MTVLIVDDNRMNVLVTAAALQRFGQGTDTVTSGEEAVAACAARSYDAVLMDLMMPGMDGYEATALIRKAEATTGAHTPIIALSARDMAGDRESALAAGLDDYLTKPIRTEVLEATLSRWIPGVPDVSSEEQ